MTDKELADRIVALGVGERVGWYHYQDKNGEIRADLYRIREDIGCDAEHFVRDWRVAGALMEKMESYDGFTLRQSGDDAGLCRIDVSGGAGVSMSMCRAINEACAEALE